jgi:hypothetical protein
MIARKIHTVVAIITFLILAVPLGITPYFIGCQIIELKKEDLKSVIFNELKPATTFVNALNIGDDFIIPENIASNLDDYGNPTIKILRDVSVQPWGVYEDGSYISFEIKDGIITNTELPPVSWTAFQARNRS